jgi:hypothetical protein
MSAHDSSYTGDFAMAAKFHVELCVQKSWHVK